MEEERIIEASYFMNLAIAIMEDYDITRVEAIEVAKAVMLKETLEDLLGRDSYNSGLDRIADTLEVVATRV
ncbi:hypothetical protein SAMN04515656_101210 [Eubacterium aggregans]|uniref:Uncharacterized protein n=1 Tax=Eubacterium aggregans TaxID=81409 RepID=A0A1H3X3B1_9FIRM|nr:hypothetical protein [Eubacterium aggregans]SDZ93905.1 hypothetical protein SAMN04515656_101210 [Eubacterium aggregans]